MGFGGGVWYSLVSDNFHDFFTEYVPFGEDAVLYFEEREFRKRFPNMLNTTNRPTVDSDAKVTIPSKSGLSWKFADTKESGSDLERNGPHMNAVDQPKPKSAERPAPAKRTPETIKKDEAAEKLKEASPGPAEKPEPEGPTKEKASPPPAPAPASETSKPVESSSSPKKMPEVNEPSVYIPITRIDPLTIKNADEPLVQDLVKILNDIILVVNADNGAGKFNSTITKAKSELAKVGQRIMDVKAAERNSTEEKLKSFQANFDSSARELVRRLEEEMRDQEAKWRDEFESERQRISDSYQDRLKAEVERSHHLMEQRNRNQLLEQAISLKKEFAAAVKERVESERDGRLARLSQLSDSVGELEKLTAEWNSVLDANLRTQHLQVAVGAVHSSLERADRPRPFVKELAALKELASEDPVVNSAIASIDPSAYRVGVPTPPQLIDRFRRVAGEVRKASLLPEDAGIASHATSFLLSKVMFKKHGRAVGDDVESILTRTETLLEEGNLDEAAREMNTLQGWAKTLSKDWLGEVRKVLEVRQALDVSFSRSLLPVSLQLLTFSPGHCNRSTSTKLKG